MIEIDDLDRALLVQLQRDARQSAGALGRKLGLSQPATWRNSGSSAEFSGESFTCPKATDTVRPTSDL